MVTSNSSGKSMEEITVGIYDWLLSDSVILLEGYQPPMFPKLDFDPEFAADLAQRIGAKIFRFPTLSYYAYYPTKHYVLHPELGGRDLLKETIEACHKRGIKVIPYIPVGHPFLPADSDLEPYNSWAKLDENGNRLTWWHHGYFDTYFICLNSPYRKAIREIVTGYDVDGIYFDGPYQDQTSSGDFCYCPYCRKAYYEKTGKEIPPSPEKRNWDDPDTVEYLNWVINDVKRGLMRELNAIIRSKDIPHLFNNCGWLANKYWGGDRYRDIDGFMFEGVHTSQEKLLHVMLGRSTGKYIWSYISSYQATRHEHLVMGLEGSVDYAGIQVYGDELINEGFTVVAGNAAPIYYSLNRIYYQQDRLDSVKTVFDYLDRHGSLLQAARNKPFIGMCVSGNTRDWWYKNDDHRNRKYRCFIYGGFNVLKDLRHQAEPFYMSDESKADFRRYRVVLLPNAACMSEEEAESIRQYVKNGGNVIATYMTSLFDEKGNQRENFALSDLFGVDYTERTAEMRRDAYIKIQKEHPVTKGFPTGRLLPQDLQYLTVNAHNADEIVAMTTGIGHDIDIAPAVIAREYGRGKVIYMTGGLEALYRTSRFGELAVIFNNGILWMTGGDIPYEVHGAPGLIVNMNETGDAILIHIVNNNGDKTKFAPVRENYVPVFNIRVKIKTGGRTVESVKLLYRDATPVYEEIPEAIEVLIPEIQHYECVCVSFRN